MRPARLFALCACTPSLHGALCASPTGAGDCLHLRGEWGLWRRHEKLQQEARDSAEEAISQAEAAKSNLKQALSLDTRGRELKKQKEGCPALASTGACAEPEAAGPGGATAGAGSEVSRAQRMQ